MINMAQIQTQITREIEIATDLLAKNPQLGLSAFVIASDTVSAERATQAVESGESTALESLYLVGSYARFQWAVKHLTRPELLSVLPGLWIASDPDDTNLAYLKIWQSAWRKCGSTIYDGQPLPRQQLLTIFRGQAGDAPGISWSLSRTVATKFAKTGGLRHRVANGRLLEGQIKPKSILAYLTGRGEHEVIVDPFQVQFSGIGKMAMPMRIGAKR